MRALRRRGHIVGYIGDGINDAPAIHAADVGLSVDGGTDVARQAADIVLLAPDLGLLAEGVAEGQPTYANIMKYVPHGYELQLWKHAVHGTRVAGAPVPAAGASADSSQQFAV